MDEATRNRLCENALAIEKFRSLHPSEQEWLLPLLSKSVRNTIDMLDQIADEKRTFEEIALIMGLNPQTVSQKLNALVGGGIAINLSGAAAYAPTGRPRKLVRR